MIKSLHIVLSYLKYKIYPIKNIKTFEDWVINNFGKQLYLIFFKSYTEKVWGIPCHEISADWAAQRIKGLSLMKTILHIFNLKNQKKLIKTLIDKFDYPIHGPGMLWEEVANKIRKNAGSIEMNSKVSKIFLSNNKVTYCCINDKNEKYYADNYISTIPIKELVQLMEPIPPKKIVKCANDLKYRDFLTVVLIVNKESLFPDNWIYIHEPEVKVGRIQNFKNWSKFMVPDKTKTSLGLEYFCNEDDELWSKSDDELIKLGIFETEKIGLIKSNWILDGTVVRMPKAYPVYDEEYKQNVQVIRDWLNKNVQNLQLVGRNGMHMYNNQDHSMLAAYFAAKNLLGENWDPWKVNADAEYIENHLINESGRLSPKRL